MLPHDDRIGSSTPLEAAWLQAPESEDLGVSSFLSAIQLKDLARAQQVATKLYQKFKKAQNNYLLWVWGPRI